MQPTDLIEHPEGGRFQEVYRAARKVKAEDGRTRTTLTHIYFSLRAGEVSRFHRVASDEVWNLYRGDGLALFLWDGEAGSSVERIVLSGAENRFCHVVPAGIWQAAEPLDAEVLVGCSVAPGFEFDDFTLIDPSSQAAQQLLITQPDLAKFID